MAEVQEVLPAEDGAAAPPAAVGAGVGQREDEEEEGDTCRFCLAPDTPENLVEPCACRGSSKYVHLECLHEWQRSLMARNQHADALRCSVCLSHFRFAPPREPVLVRLRRLVVTHVLPSCVALGGILLRHPVWSPLVVCLSLFVLAQNQTFGVQACVLAAFVVLPFFLLPFGVRTGPGGGLFLMRQGAPVDNVRPGTLLVATEAISRGIFHRSVVLLLNHSSQHGSIGIMLNGPELRDMPLPEPLRHVPRVQHRLGGPVPGAVFTLHTVPGVAHARVLPLSRDTPPAEARAQPLTGDEGEDAVAREAQQARLQRRRQQILYYDGRLDQVAAGIVGHHATPQGQPEGASGGGDEAEEGATRPGEQDAGGATQHHHQDSDDIRLCLVYSECAGWAPYQLDGELRAGAWRYLDCNLDHLFMARDHPEQLWATVFDQANVV